MSESEPSLARKSHFLASLSQAQLGYPPCLSPTLSPSRAEPAQAFWLKPAQAFWLKPARAWASLLHSAVGWNSCTVPKNLNNHQTESVESKGAREAKSLFHCFRTLQSICPCPNSPGTEIYSNILVKIKFCWPEQPFSGLRLGDFRWVP